MSISAHLVLVPDHNQINRFFRSSPTFKVPPRPGDFFTTDDPEGIGQAFRILSVIHPDPFEGRNDNRTDVEIHVEHIGTSTQLMMYLNEGAIPPTIQGPASPQLRKQLAIWDDPYDDREEHERG